MKSYTFAEPSTELTFRCVAITETRSASKLIVRINVKVSNFATITFLTFNVLFADTVTIQGVTTRAIGQAAFR